MPDGSSDGGSAVRVVVRVRPFNSQETSSASGTPEQQKSVFKTPCAQEVAIRAPGEQGSEMRFRFDQVYWSNEVDNTEGDQDVIHNKVGAELIANAFAGYNCCLFAYGQTGSGKTHTMMGEWEHPKLKGVIPRACEDIFARMKATRAERSDISYTLNVSYMEIYLEHVYDLLTTHRRNQQSSSLKVRQHPQEGVFVEGLTRVPVSTLDAVMQIISQGNDVRHTGTTKMNARSSRSHALLILHFTQMELSPNGDSSNTREAKINLVDLAGSERIKKSEVEGGAFTEATKINLSLTTLGRVIDALADLSGNKGNKIIQPPYRESNLTHILSDSLGGNSKTTMLATISPHASNFDETTSTLRYASRAREIVNKAVVNEDPGLRKIRALQEEVDRLTREIRAIRNKEQLSEIIDLRLEVDLLKKRLQEMTEKNYQLKERLYNMERAMRNTSGTHGHNSATLAVPKQGSAVRTASPNPRALGAKKESFTRGDTMPTAGDTKGGKDKEDREGLAFSRTTSLDMNSIARNVGLTPPQASRTLSPMPTREGAPEDPPKVKKVVKKKDDSKRLAEEVSELRASALKEEKKAILAQQQTKRAEKEVEKRMKAVEKEKEALERQLKSAQLETNRMKKTMTQMSKEKTIADRKIEKLKSKSTPLNKSLSELPGLGSGSTASSDGNASEISSVSTLNQTTGRAGQLGVQVKELEKELKVVAAEKADIAKMLREECLAKNLAQEEVDALGQQLDLARTVQEQTLAEQRTLRTELQAVRAENAELTGEVKERRERGREAEAVRVELKQQAARLGELMRELEGARGEIADWKQLSATDDPRAAGDALQALQKERDAARREVDMVTQEKHEETAVRESLQGKLIDAETRWKAVDNELKDAQAARDTALARTRVLEEEKADGEQRLRTVAAAVEKKKEEVKTLVADLDRARGELKARDATSDKDRVAYETANANMVDALALKDAEIEEHKAALVRADDTHKADLARYRGQVEADMASIEEELRTVRQEAQHEKERLEKGLAEVQKTEKELAAAKASLTASLKRETDAHVLLQTKHDALKKDHSLLSSRLGALQKTHTDAKADSDTLTGQHQELQTKHTAALKDIDARKKEKVELEKQLKALTGRAAELEADRDAVAGGQKKTQEALSTREAALETQKKEKAAVEAQLAELKGEHAELKESLGEAEEKYDTAVNAFSRVNKQWEKKERDWLAAKKKLGEEATKLTELKDSIEAQHAALEKELAAAKTRDKEQNGKYTAVAADKAALAEQLEASQAAHKAAEAKHAALAETHRALDEKHKAVLAASEQDQSAWEKARTAHAEEAKVAAARQAELEQQLAAVTKAREAAEEAYAAAQEKYDAAVGVFSKDQRAWEKKSGEHAAEAQAAAAREKELEEQLRALEGRYAALEADHAGVEEKYTTAVAGFSRDSRAWETREKEVTAELAAAGGEKERLEVELARATAKFEEEKGRVAEAMAEAAARDTQLKDERSAAAEEKAALEAKLEAEKDAMKTLRVEHKQLSETHAKSVAALEAAKNRHAALDEKHKAVLAASEQDQSAWEKARTAHAEEAKVAAARQAELEQQLAAVTKAREAAEEAYAAAQEKYDAAVGVFSKDQRAWEKKSGEHATEAQAAAAREKELEEQLEALRSTHATLGARGKEMTAELAAAGEEKERLEGELARATAKFEEEKGRVAEAMAEAAARDTQLKEERSAAAGEKAALEAKLEAEKETVKSLNEAQTEGAAALREVDERHRALTDAHRELEARHHAAVAASERDRSAWEKKTEAHAAESEAAAGRQADLKQQLEALQSKHAALEALGEEERARLEGGLKEALEKCEATRRDLAAAVDAATTRDAQVAEERTAAASETAALQAQLATEAQAAKELRAEHDELRETHAKRIAAHEDAEARHTALDEQHQAALAAAEADRQAWEASRAAHNEQADAAAAREKELEEQLEALRSTHATLGARGKEMTAELAAAGEEKERLEGELAAAEERCTATRGELAAAVAEVSARDAQLKEERSTATEERAALAAKLEAEEEAGRELRAAHDSLREEQATEVAARTREAKQQEGRAVGAEADLAVARGEIASHLAKVTELTAALERQVAEGLDLQQSGAGKAAEIAALMQSLADAEARGEALDAQVAERTAAVAEYERDTALLSEAAARERAQRFETRKARARDILCPTLAERTRSASLRTGYTRLRQFATQQRRAAVRTQRVAYLETRTQTAADAGLLRSAYGAWVQWYACCLAKARTQLDADLAEQKQLSSVLHHQNITYYQRLSAFEEERNFLSEKVIKYKSLYKQCKERTSEARGKEKRVRASLTNVFAQPPSRSASGHLQPRRQTIGHSRSAENLFAAHKRNSDAGHNASPSRHGLAPRTMSVGSQLGLDSATHEWTPFSSQLPSPCSAATNDYLNSPRFARALEDMAAHMYMPSGRSSIVSLDSQSPPLSPVKQQRQMFQNLRVNIPAEGQPQQPAGEGSTPVVVGEERSVRVGFAPPHPESSFDKPPRPPPLQVRPHEGGMGKRKGSGRSPLRTPSFEAETSATEAALKRPAIFDACLSKIIRRSALSARRSRGVRTGVTCRTLRVRHAVFQRLWRAVRDGGRVNASLTRQLQTERKSRKITRGELDDLRSSAWAAALNAEASQNVDDAAPDAAAARLQQRADVVMLKVQELYFNTLDRAEVLYLSACRQVEAVFHQFEVDALSSELKACSFYMRHRPRRRCELEEEALMVQHDDEAYVRTAWDIHDRKVDAAERNLRAVRLGPALRRKEVVRHKRRGTAAVASPAHPERTPDNKYVDPQHPKCAQQ